MVACCLLLLLLTLSQTLSSDRFKGRVNDPPDTHHSCSSLVSTNSVRRVVPGAVDGCGGVEAVVMGECNGEGVLIGVEVLRVGCLVTCGKEILKCVWRC